MHDALIVSVIVTAFIMNILVSFYNMFFCVFAVIMEELV